MRSVVSGLVPCLAACLLAQGCAPDIATDPGDGFVVRAYTLDDGETVWVEALVEDDMGLRKAVLEIDDGLRVEDLAEELAMGEEYELVLDSTHEVLIVEIDDFARAWIWPG